ncbi:MAG: hypothetical protein IJX28_03360 [Clostridia bacterium]|nr:hypothetical protein [Clostridia bacterium]
MGSVKEFLSYSPEDAIEKNLRENQQRAEGLSEQEMAHLQELAVEITQDCQAYPNWIESLPDQRPPMFPPRSSSIRENRQALTQLQGIRATWQSAFLCIEMRKILQERHLLSPSLFFPDPELADLREDARVVYQRNSYSDSAFLCFSKKKKHLQATYTHSFQAACEDVYNGLCELCILPVETSAEGQLSSFSKLIDRYELKIVSICEILGTDASKATRFALLQKQLPTVWPTGKETFLEISLPLEESPSPAAILLAAELCGLRPYRLDSIPAASSQGFSARFVFRTDHADLYAYLLYLAMEAPHYIPVGIYSKI